MSQISETLSEDHDHFVFFVELTRAGAIMCIVVVKNDANNTGDECMMVL